MSSEDDRGQFDLSRRKLLGSVATIGAAGAIGGAGTMAFFSDEEEFANNQLTAGELDLKVDWEEHYSDWSDDEAENLQDDVVMTNGDPANVPTDYVGLPDPTEPLIAVNAANGGNGDLSDLEQFMNNTSIEAYPDVVGDDGVQDPFGENGVGDICTDGADTPEALDSDLRTEGSRGEPLINLNDVKPGDFGELTLSFHICGNDGYVWLTGAPVAAAENGNTEPEDKDADEEGPDDEEATGQDVLDSDVELLDKVQTTWWYDDGDNVLSGGAGGQVNEVDVMIVFDRSGSMDDDTNDPTTSDKWQNAQQGAIDLATALGPGAQVGLVPYNQDASVTDTLGSSPASIETTINNLTPTGNTDIQEAIADAQDELVNGSNARAGVDKVMVVLTNGTPTSTGEQAVINEANNAKGAGTTIYGISYGQNANDSLIEEISSSSPKNGTIGPEDAFAFEGDATDIGSIFEQIGTIISVPGEEVIFRGTLRDSLTALSSGNGIPLDGNLDTQFDEINDPDDADARECFMGSNDYYIGFAWYLPVNHANEIQGDSVSFDLGFYTEQCRHNSGIGNRQANS
jgi:predicted ribosomally synthesized peptide with SipW-like signal peptide